jgi:hypothetical protein
MMMMMMMMMNEDLTTEVSSKTKKPSDSGHPSSLSTGWPMQTS